MKRTRFLAERGACDRLPSDRSDGRSASTMQGLAGIRVGILIGKPQ